MGVSPGNTASHFLHWEDIENLVLCVQFMRVKHGGKLHSETHKRLADTVNSFSCLPSASKAGFETIHMLWMSLLTVQRPILHTERIPQTCILIIIWESTFVEHNLVRPTGAWQMHREAPPICLMHLRKVLKHFISNGCLSLQFNISFYILRGYPKCGILR